MFGRKRLACSFCGKSEAEVAKLVAGRGVYICDRCAGVAVRIMAQEGGDRPPRPAESVARRVLRRIRRAWRRSGARLRQPCVAAS
jgi:ATP-dependent Clp protease ATP-binding subunit ClpX